MADRPQKKTWELLAEQLARRILVLDGAMGSLIQGYGLTEKDFRGDRFADHRCDLQGNNDVLCLTRPDVIREIHLAYLAAGADIITTNTFGATAISQADYRTQDHVYEMNLAAGRLARAAVDRYTAQNPDRPRFVLGGLGPTSKTCSISPDVEDPGLRAVTFDQMKAAYQEAAAGLIDGGVDILGVETVFDTLNAKAAILAILELFAERGRELPVLVSGSIVDLSGRTLSGQTTEAFWNSIRHARPFCVGLNCSLGAEELRPYLQELSRIADLPVAFYPNAGLPNELGGYDETPAQMAAVLGDLARQGLLNIAGCCCGTGPDFTAAIAAAVADLPPRPIPDRPTRCRLSGLEPLNIGPDSLFVNVGERTNVAGSRKFARLIREERFEDALEVARQQVRSGAQVIDVSLDDPLLDAAPAMTRLLNLAAADPEICRVPVMLDSSQWPVFEVGLKCLQGKGIVNSISLKDGEPAFKEKAALILRHGAAVVVMAFDEKGQAETYERKLEICRRAYRILTEEVGFPPEDIILDPNIFAVATGLAEHRRHAIDFIEACRTIKAELPGVLVSGGVSNLSFSFRGNNTVREAMHSAFLYHAIAAGMDLGIVNAGQLAVYEEIPPDLLVAIEDVLFDRRPDATERLVELAATTRDRPQQATEAEAWRAGPVADRLSHALVHGLGDHIEADCLEALREHDSALAVIEGPLLEGMNTVGELFGAGKMFLPQVIRSARVMRKAVAVLEPHLAQAGRPPSRGRILLATVKGDVHDIGKNILGVVLGCNGYEVIDLGVMAPAEKILQVAGEQDVDLVGLSGLITPSLQEMVHVASEMQRAGLQVPLLVGGATTSRRHTALKIAPAYSGTVLHVPDASRAVAPVRKLLDQKQRTEFAARIEQDHTELRAAGERPRRASLISIAEARRRRFAPDWDGYEPPQPARPGVQVFTDYPLVELAPAIDWQAFRRAWKLPGGRADAETRRLLADAQALLQRIEQEELLQMRAVVGLFPAAAAGDDIEIYRDDSRDEILGVIPCLRQQVDRGEGKPSLCLADFVAPRETGLADHVGAFVVTAAPGAVAAEQDEYHGLLLQALADRLAEAFAERMHQRVRTEFWGYAPEEQNRGIRPAPGYPACPDHTAKGLLLRLLAAEQNLGVSLTENYALIPAATVAGWYLSHPGSRYFGLGRIGRDQVTDYAQRQAKTVAEVERWLAPHLAYEPAGE